MVFQVNALKPDYVAPLVAYLCHESSAVNGEVFEVGAGWIARIRWQRSQGHFFSNEPLTPEAIQKDWEKVVDFANANNPSSISESSGAVVSFLNQRDSLKSNNTSGSVDLNQALGYTAPPVETVLTDRDTILYALAIGAAKDQMDPKELQFTYENSNPFKAIPSIGNQSIFWK